MPWHLSLCPSILIQVYSVGRVAVKRLSAGKKRGKEEPVLAFLVLAGQLAFASPQPLCGLPPAAIRDLDQPKALSQPAKHPRVHRRARSSPDKAKCLRLELLQRREALLHDFLIRAQTETPQFEDRRTYRLDVGVKVGPVVVTRDFIGSPIIRARVTNLSAADISFLLSAQLSSKSGAVSGASTVVLLHAYETRSIELLCPDNLVPQSLTWSTLPL
jgi:hypothetical protein